MAVGGHWKLDHSTSPIEQRDTGTRRHFADHRQRHCAAGVVRRLESRRRHAKTKFIVITAGELQRKPRVGRRESITCARCRKFGGADLRADTTGRADVAKIAKQRSEEHTSELQSLMRISYDVFSLKTNNT